MKLRTKVKRRIAQWALACERMPDRYEGSALWIVRKIEAGDMDDILEPKPRAKRKQPKRGRKG